MSAKNIKKFRLTGLAIAVVLAIVFREKILLIAGVYWGVIIVLTITLKFVNPDEYSKLKSKSYEDELEYEVEEPDPESKDNTDVLRNSCLNGKYSFGVLLGGFITVLIGGFVFIVCTGVEYDENQCYLAAENFFNRSLSDFLVFQIIPLIVAAALTAIACARIYEIITGVVTPKEKEKHGVSIGKSILLAVVPIAIVVAMLFTIQNWATVLTEEGIVVYRPWKETVCYRWEDTVSFAYDEGDSFTSPEADIKFENGIELHVDFHDFQRSNRLYEVYGRVWENGKLVMSEEDLFFQDIFLDKYGHLNSTDS